MRAHTYQVIERSSRHENELAPCDAKALERVDRGVIDRAVVRERSVIIGGKRKIAHTGNPAFRSMTSAINGFAERDILDQRDKPPAVSEQSKSDLQHPLAHPSELLQEFPGRSIVE